MNRAIVTLPLMPVDGNNLGKYVTPIVAETLANIYFAKYYHCVNLLDSFNNREELLGGYLDSLLHNNINYDVLWIDKVHLNELINNIYILIERKFITEKISDIYYCNCGIVEIEKSKIKTCNPQKANFYIKNEKVICKHCGSICNEHKNKILIFTPKNITLSDIIFFPKFYNDDSKTYEEIILKSYINISRIRNTGISINYNNSSYNIDIDFLWSTFLTTIPEPEKIVVSGNKMSYELFLVGLLEKCLNENAKTILLATPYLKNLNSIVTEDKFYFNSELKKILILLNLKWNIKEKNYDSSILTYLNKLSDTDLNSLYKIMNIPLEEGSLETIISNNFNMQECIKKLKLEKRRYGKR